MQTIRHFPHTQQESRSLSKRLRIPFTQQSKSWDQETVVQLLGLEDL